MSKDYRILSVNNIRAYEKDMIDLELLDKDEEHRLINAYYDNNDVKALDKLTYHNMRTVFYLAKQFLGYQLPYDDLVQSGTIGLLEALKNFDTSKDVKFASFAVYRIKGAISEYVQKNWRIVNVVTSKPARKLFYKLRKYKSNDSHEWFTVDQIDEISKELDVKFADIVSMEAKLYAEHYEMDNAELLGHEADIMIVNPNDTNPIVMLENQETKDHFFTELDRMKNIINSLDDRSKSVMTNRWLTDKKSTMKELAKTHKVSDTRICQIEQNVIKQLREEMVVEECA